MPTPFVGPDFEPPVPPHHGDFRLAPLTLAHNAADLDAWSSSVAHIHATPGFAVRPWPDEPMTLARNAADIEAHLHEFAVRQGFTYTVLDRPGSRVIGCAYIYPSPVEGVDADVRSWVRASHAALDVPLWRYVITWLRDSWPFATVTYASRDGVGPGVP